MKIIDASYEIRRLNLEDDIREIAHAYCMCYRMPLPESYQDRCDIIRRHRKHESCLEHSIMTVEFTINRGIGYEIIRHRHTHLDHAVTQESTRYCNYSKDKFGNELTFINNSAFVKDSHEYDIWVQGLQADEDEYMYLVKMGMKPEEARDCLPNALSTRLKISANFREWRNIFKLRCDSHAHYQMREVMQPLCSQMIVEAPCVFDDLTDILVESVMHNERR